jgi:hypothetical protein
MSVTKSNQNNLTSPNGNSLAVFVDINDNALKLKDINGGVEPITNYTGSSSVGLLQLQGGVAISSTLTSVTDQNNTTSPLKLSTTDVQVLSPLRITTADASGFYLDCEDSSTNNRFSIKRDPSSQEVTLDFASNPIGSTTLVGAIRTYQDGINLSNAMSFIEDGSVGIGTNAPVGILHLKTAAKNTRLAIDGDAGFNRLISYRTGGLQRFGLYVNNTAESGSNAGSNFAIRAYNDAGTLLSTPFFINRASGNVGIGTTAPIAPLNVYNSSASVSNLLLLEQDTSAIIGQIINYRKNGSVNLTSGTEIGRLAFGGYFNSTYSPPSQTCSAIYGYYGGTGTDRVGGLRLVTWNGGGLTTRLQVAPDGKIGIGTTIATAKFEILGEGSTSATSSLLVQNSLGNESFRVYDDRIVSIPYRVETPFIRNSSGNLVLFAGNFEVEIQSSNPTSGSGSLRTTGDITTTDNQTKSIINVNNLVSSTPAAFNTLNGFAFTSTITQTTGTIRGLFINPTLNASTDFRAIEATSGNVLIGNSASNTAKLSIKGSGSTSATTSLLVQNNAGTNLLQVADDGILYLGTTASGLGSIYVPRSSTFGNRNFLFNQDGTALMYTRSNDLIGFNTTVFFNADVNVAGNYRTTLRLTPNLSAASSTDSLIINSGTTWSTQANGTCIGINLQPIIDTDASSSSAKYIGFYWNPNLADLQSATHYGIQTTSGGAYINTATPNAAACLQADSTTQGFLPPRMTTAQKVTLAATATAGLMIYDTNLNKLCVYTGAGWETITSV